MMGSQFKKEKKRKKSENSFPQYNIITEGPFRTFMTYAFVYCDLHSKQHCCSTLILSQTDLVKSLAL